MSSLLRHHSDHRLLPSLLTSPSRRRVDFANTTDQTLPDREFNSQSARSERLAQALGLQQESVLNYGSRINYSDLRIVSESNDLATNFSSLTISNRNSNHNRPATVPLQRSLIGLAQETTFNPHANGPFGGIRNRRDRNPLNRRIGRNVQRLRIESRELIENLTNENIVPQDDVSRREAGERLRNTTLPTLPDLHYLQTYDMRNNFYLNLVTWSRVNNKIAVAVKEKAYWWDGLKHVAPINLNGNLRSISVISCSPSNILAVGVQDGIKGSLCLIFPDQRSITYSHNCALQCLTWFPNMPYLIAGDMAGAMIIFEYSETTILVKSIWKSFDQQVCGMLKKLININRVFVFNIHSSCLHFY